MKSALIAVFAALVGLCLVMNDADARRLGGGTSSGMQRSLPAKRDAAPTQNPAPTSPAQQATGASRWLGPLAGIAAGIGLAALLSHFGLGEEFATVVMLFLIVAVVFFVIRLFLRRLQPQSAPMQYAGHPDHGSMAREIPASGTSGASDRIATGAYANMPPDFDPESFLRHAKLNFVRLQAANDAGDMEDIRKFTTPEMYAEIKLQLQERRGAPQKTDVVSLNAELLDVTTEFRQHIASVRFFGTLRETADGAPAPFDEIWHITKPVDDSRNWAIAGIQQAS